MAKTDKTLEFLNATITAKDEIIRLNEENISIMQEIIATQKESKETLQRIINLDDTLIKVYKSMYDKSKKENFKFFLIGAATMLISFCIVNLITECLL